MYMNIMNTRIVFSPKKEGNSDTSYMNEPWGQYAEWNKPVTKEKCYMIPFIRGNEMSQIHRDRQ